MKKIKKLTYAEMTKVSTRLTREEMRQIMAGSGPGGGGGCDCGTAPGCTYNGCSTASSYFNCLMAACSADCNPPSCSYECTSQVSSSWQQTIASCGTEYG